MQLKKALTYNISLKLLNVITGFFINVLFVRIMGAGISGDFFYLITILSFITLVVGISMESGITLYASRNQTNATPLAWLVLCVSVLQFMITYLVISLIYGTTSIFSEYYYVIFIIGNILISNFSALFVSKKWFIPLNTIILGINLFMLLYFCLIENGYLKIKGQSVSIAQKVFIIAYLSQGFGLTIFFFIKNKMHQEWALPSFELIKKVLMFSLLALAGNISFLLATRIDYVFVKAFCSAVELGNYVQVSKIAQMFVIVPGMIASVIYPYTAMAGNENMLAKIQWLCRLMTLVFIVAAIGIILTGKWLFPWFFGDEFNLMYPAMLFYLPGIFCLCITTILAAYLGGKGLIHLNVIASVIALLIVVVGDLLLIPKWGIMAAAAVSSAGYLGCMLYLLRYYSIRLNTNSIDFFSISLNELGSLVLTKKTN